MRTTPRSTRVGTALLLLCIVVMGFAFRFVGIDWGEGQAIHPDEEFLRQVTAAVRWPDRLGLYFDTAHSSLNPYNHGYGFFVYGTFPLFVTRAAGELLDAGCEQPASLPAHLLAPLLVGRPAEECWPGSFSGSRVTGRALAALFDLGTLIVVFFAGRRLRSSGTGLLASLLYALSVIPIQQAHFYTVDAFAGFFSVVVLYLVIRGVQTGGWGTFALAGLATGMGMACKISVWPLGLLIVLAGVVWGLLNGPERQTGAPQDPEADEMAAQSQPEASDESEREIRLFLGIAGRIALAAVVALLALRIFQPYAFMGPGFFGLCPNEQWWDNMLEIRRQSSGAVDVYHGQQWANRAPLVFPWLNIVFWGLGLPLGLVVWAAWAVAGVVLVRRRQEPQHAASLLLVWTWMTAYFLYQGSQWVKSIRYFLPIYPAFALLAAWLIVWLFRRAWGTTGRRWLRWAAAGVGVVAVAGAALWALASTSIYTRSHTRIAASRWAFENIPTAATVHLRTAEGEDQVHVVIRAPTSYVEGMPVLTPFEVDAEGDLVGVTLNRMSDPHGDAEPERFRVAVATDAAGQAVLAAETKDVALPPGWEGVRVSLSLESQQLYPGVPYYVVAQVVEGGSVQLLDSTVILHLRIVEPETGLQAGGEIELRVELPAKTVSSDGGPLIAQFEVEDEMILLGASLEHVADPQGDPEPERFRLAVAYDAAGQAVLAETFEELSPPPFGHGVPVSFPLAPQRLLPGTTYYLLTEVLAGGPVELYTSVLATEHWDWPPPLRVDGRDPFGGMYRGLSTSSDGTLQLYYDDTRQKRADLLDWLDEADYIVTGSNRLYASIPRLSPRYPLTMAYYEALFNGDLGFELVADFVSPMSVGPFQFPDQEEPFAIPEALYQVRPAPVSVPMPPAEEAFSVYDHPRVLIFRKTDAYSRARAEALLPASLVDEAIWVTALDVTRGKPGPVREETRGALLAPELREEQQAGGTWSDMFDRQSPLNRSVWLGATVWYVAAAVLGWLAFPLLFAGLPRLYDRGHGLARPVGLLVVSYLTWLLSSLHLLPNRRGTIVLTVVLLAVAGGAVAWRRRRSLRAFLRARWRVVVVQEALGLVLFVVWTYVRARNPDLWHPVVGGEKPMDFAYFNAVVRSTWFPPYDPWFAGGQLNYYYFGFQLAATLTKLLGIMPSISYNLNLSLFYAMVGTVTFSVAFNLVASRRERRRGAAGLSPYVAGGLAVLFLLVLGNLGEVRLLFNAFRMVAGEPPFESTIPGWAELVQAAQGFLEVLRGASLPLRNESFYWEPTRMLPFPAFVEFPSFTFLYGDPHAHMFALPYTLVALGLALNWARGGYRLRAGWFLSCLVGSVVIGSLLATNTWDYPTYLAVGLAGLTLGMGFSTRRILGLAWRTVLLAAISYLLFLPYMRNYVPAVSGLEIFRGDRVPLSTYVLLVGQFLFPLVTLLAIDAWRLVRPEWTARGQSWRLALVLGAGGMLLAGLAMSLLGIPVGAVTLVVGAAAVSLALTSTLSVERRMVWLLLAAAMGLCLAVEIVSVGGDRMNTVFKFYYQVWTFLAIGAAVALVWLVPHTDRWPIEWHQLWWAMIGILVLATALFPVLSLPAKMRDRFSDLTGPTLDGMAYIAYSVTGDTKGTVDVRPDYEALVWLQENVEGSPVILEGLGEREYLWGNRVSVYTGLPTVVGWRWHQVQQRMATVAGEVERRHLDVYTCYATPAEAQAWEIIRRYDVRYIYVGPYERLYYDPQGLAKFDAMVASGGLQVVYDRGGVRIYEVVR